MKSELAEEIFELIEARSHARPTPMEFEMAYQAGVAIDRIRFAIKHMEQKVRGSNPLGRTTLSTYGLRPFCCPPKTHPKPQRNLNGHAPH